MSGSDDCTVKMWDARAKSFIASYELDYQVTCVNFSQDNNYLFFGGIDNSVKALNLTKNEVEFALLGHGDTITGLEVSHKGDRLVTNSMDNTVR